MIRPGPPFVGSYGMNQWLFVPGGFGPGVWAGTSRQSLLGVDVFSLRSPGNIPLLLDSAAASGRFSGGPPPMEEANLNPFCINRHGGSINALFLDWSVRRVGLKDLWTLKWWQNFDTAGPWTKAGGVTPEQWPKWIRRFKD
jgi:prepilin-type processing-associated H-X9-DG protein